MKLLSEIEAAIELLRNGQSARLDNLLFEPSENSISVIGWSAYRNFSSLTKQIAIGELQEIKSTLNTIILKNPQLSFLKTEQLVYILAFDEGGKGSIRLCKEVSSKIEWLATLKD